MQCQLNRLQLDYNDQQFETNTAVTNPNPNIQNPNQEATLTQPTPLTTPNPVIFDCVDADLIRHSAKQTKGSAASMLMHGESSVVPSGMRPMTSVMPWPQLLVASALSMYTHQQ